MKTNNYLFLSLCLCIPLFALTGCDNDSSEEPFGTDTERYDIPLDTKSLEVNARGQKFAFNFYKEMAGKEESNFCISPLSASFCLGMVLNGANGNTYTELQEALGYEGLTNEEINAYAQMMQTELPKLDGRTVFMNANSMWIKDDFQMLEPFVKTNQTYYNAEVYNEPFNMETVDKINHWCANKTNDLIPKMLETISPNTLACLINAIYFKGVWKMELVAILDELERKVTHDKVLRETLLRTRMAEDPYGAFCRTCREAGYEIYEMDLICAGEEFHAAMKRSTNGGGENSPMLSGEDDFYELFMAALEADDRMEK